jgi:hypothetical protein
VLVLGPPIIAAVFRAFPTLKNKQKSEDT